jgi:hypothetical protein
MRLANSAHHGTANTSTPAHFPPGAFSKYDSGRIHSPLRRKPGRRIRLRRVPPREAEWPGMAADRPGNCSVHRPPFSGGVALDRLFPTRSTSLIPGVVDRLFPTRSISPVVPLASRQSCRRPTYLAGCVAWRRIASATAPALPYLLHPCSRAGIRPTYIVKKSKIYANHYITIVPYTRTHSGRAGIADSRDASPLSGAAASSQSLISRKWSSASEPIASKKRIRFLI